MYAIGSPALKQQLSKYWGTATVHFNKGFQNFGKFRLFLKQGLPYGLKIVWDLRIFWKVILHGEGASPLSKPKSSVTSMQCHHKFMAIKITLPIFIMTIDLIVIMINLSLALPPRLSPMSPKACPRFTPFASSLSNTIAVNIFQNTILEKWFWEILSEMY